MTTWEEVAIFAGVFVLVTMFVFWLLVPKCKQTPTKNPFWYKREVRHFARKNNKQTVRVFLTCNISGRMCEGRVIDSSEGGLGLYIGPEIIRLHLAVGSRWIVKPTTSCEPAFVEVRNFIRDGHGWRVGCRFVKPVDVNLLYCFQG